MHSYLSDLESAVHSRRLYCSTFSRFKLCVHSHCKPFFWFLNKNLLHTIIGYYDVFVCIRITFSLSRYNIWKVNWNVKRRELLKKTCKRSSQYILMVAYICHHLSDTSVDLSDLYVDLSIIYFDLSDHCIDLSEKHHHN